MRLGQLGLCVLIFGNPHSEALKTAQSSSDPHINI